MTPQQAEELLERYQQGKCTEEETRLVENWLESHGPKVNPEWDKTQFLKDLDKGIHSITGVSIGKRKVRRIWRRMVAAASIIILLGAGTLLLMKNNNSKRIMAAADIRYTGNDVLPGTNGAILTLSNGNKVVLDTTTNGQLAIQQKTDVIKAGGQIAYHSEDSNDAPMTYNTLTTTKGRQFQVVLEDGTRAWLNAESSITYPVSFSGKERKVEVNGEVYFEVAKDAAKPFRVNVAGKGEVEVLGTHFNVNSYSDEPEIKVTLLEGSIRMKDNILKPGEQATIRNGNIEVKQADVNEAVAWKNGKFQYLSADLKTLLRQFARWYDVEVVYDGNIPSRKFFVIMDRNSKLSEVLNALKANEVKFRIEGNKLTVSK